MCERFIGGFNSLGQQTKNLYDIRNYWTYHRYHNKILYLQKVI